jgi:8-oxo-dGTP pyrophosphatase MutT (NUDIX family)
MSVLRPASGEELNEGPETPPRVAASVIVLRESHEEMEVLLVQRNPAARFMGGAWVFPGGAVQGDESPAEAGLRELREEASIDVDGGAEALVPFSRWITPAEVKLRFDTFFFAVEAPADAEAHVDGGECVAASWLRPADALAAYGRGELSLVFPTIKHLEQLATTPSVAATLEAARARVVEPVQPRIVVVDGSAQVLLPGEPGFDDPDSAGAA